MICNPPMTGPQKDRCGIACAGNWIVDVVHSIDHWPAKSDLVQIHTEAEGVGGGAANVALGLAAFDTGLPVFAVGLLGQDRHAETVRRACAAAWVDMRWLGATSAAPTAHTHVMTVPGDSRTFFYHPGSNDLLAEPDVPVADMSNLRLFYLGYLNLLARLDAQDAGSTGATRLLARARAVGLITCVDLVSRDHPEFRASVETALPQIDYLFLNEVEAQRATGIGVSGPADAAGLVLAADHLLARGVGRAVVMHTAELAIWAGADGLRLTRPAQIVPPQDIVSPVGAGDAFCAGVLLAIHEGWSPEVALTLAHRAAAAALRGATATDAIPPLARLMPDHSPIGQRITTGE